MRKGRAFPVAPVIAAWALAVWPIWPWYAERILQSDENRWGSLALLTALALARRSRKRAAAASLRWPLALPSFFLVVYAATHPFVPPQIRGLIAMSGLAGILSALSLGKRIDLATWGLLVLAMPIVPSLQFFLGYPMRVASGTLAAFFLRASGFAVERLGTGLVWGKTAIAIDAPCSGIRMLWTGGYLVLALAAYHGLDAGRTLLSGLVGLVMIVLGNALRSSALFLIEARVLDLPHWTHDGVGIATFFLVAVAIATGIRVLLRFLPCAPTPSSSAPV